MELFPTFCTHCSHADFFFFCRSLNLKMISTLECLLQTQIRGKNTHAQAETIRWKTQSYTAIRVTGKSRLHQRIPDGASDLLGGGEFVIYAIREKQIKHKYLLPSTFLNNWQVTQWYLLNGWVQKLMRPEELLYPIGILGAQIPRLTFYPSGKSRWFSTLNWLFGGLLFGPPQDFGDPGKVKRWSEEMYAEQLLLWVEKNSIEWT